MMFPLVAEKVSVVVWFRFTRDQLQKAEEVFHLKQLAANIVSQPGCRVGMNQVRLLEEGYK